MAITTCKECGGKVSTKADACPGCGAKRNVAAKSFSKLFGKLVGIVVGLIVFLMVMKAMTPT